MPSTRSPITVASLPPSRSRAATNSDNTSSSSASACACRPAGSVASVRSTPGNCSSSVNSTRNDGKRACMSSASSASGPTTCGFSLGASARSGARRRSTTSTLPRAMRAAMRSRTAGSSARISSGRRTPVSRKRWLTARTSQPSVPHSVARSAEAKAVMLRIMPASCKGAGSMPFRPGRHGCGC